MADFRHVFDQESDVPPLVSEWCCSICSDDGEIHGEAACEHIKLLREHAPESELLGAELDDQDDAAYWEETQERRYAALNGTL